MLWLKIVLDKVFNSKIAKSYFSEVFKTFAFETFPIPFLLQLYLLFNYMIICNELSISYNKSTPISIDCKFKFFIIRNYFFDCNFNFLFFVFFISSSSFLFSFSCSIIFFFVFVVLSSLSLESLAFLILY